MIKQKNTKKTLNATVTLKANRFTLQTFDCISMDFFQVHKYNVPSSVVVLVIAAFFTWYCGGNFLPDLSINRPY